MITQPLDDHQHPTPPPNPDDHIAIREPRKTQMKSKPKLIKSNPDEITTAISTQHHPTITDLPPQPISAFDNPNTKSTKSNQKITQNQHKTT